MQRIERVQNFFIGFCHCDAYVLFGLLLVVKRQVVLNGQLSQRFQLRQFFAQF